MASTKVTGVIGRFPSGLSNGAERDVRLAQSGSLMVEQALPAMVEQGRAGQRYYYSGGVVANGQVPVIDIPTTTAKYCLWNGETVTTGKSLIIETVYAVAASGTVGLGAGLFIGVTGTVQAGAVASGTGVVLGNASGSAADSLAKFGNGTTLTANPGWVCVASVTTGETVSIGAGLVANVNGQFIVPPNKCLGIVVVAPLGTTAKYTCGVIWSERYLDLE